MKKVLIKAGSFLAVFVLTLLAANILLNRGSDDMTSAMAGPTLPIVYMNVNDEYINPLHGYTDVMEGNYLRGPITPLMANREISFRADLYDSVISGVGFEVRSLDMQRLVEDTAVTDFYTEDTFLYGNIQIKDLIDEDEEYLLIIKLTKSSGEVIRYYTRVINRAELAIEEKVSFVRDFSERTLDKEAAKELKQYMESNSEGDNSSFAYVNIHSSFKQLTWGNLQPLVSTGKELELLEIDGKTASIMLTYQVEINGEEHNVTEFFRILKGNKRMYLLEYERKMNQVFNMEKNVVVNGKILHGIVEDKPKITESESGATLCFVQQNQLYSYNPSSGQLSEVFAFCDKDYDDSRTRYNAHSVKPLQMDEIGNIWFIVYGYMNRGLHEGQVGVTMYYYDYVLNTIEEQFFIPYTKSYQLLKQQINNLSYINIRNDFYLLLDGTIYCIDIESHTVTNVAENISPEKFESSYDGKVIAWANMDDETGKSEIKLLNLDWTNPSTIEAPANATVLPLGFMDNDLVYGIARDDDTTRDDAGKSVTPMYAVRIQDTSGNVLKEYSYQGIYVTDTEITDNMIIMDRLRKDEATGQYEETTQDQIMNNEVASTKKNVLSSVVTEDTETTYQTILRREPSTKSPKLTNPKEIIFEGERLIELTNDTVQNIFYVYAKKDIQGLYTDPTEAVYRANEVGGVVIDKNSSYIWEAENRKSSTRISKIDVPANQTIYAPVSLGEDEEIATVNVEVPETEEEQAQQVINTDDEFGNETASVGDERAQIMYGLCLDAMLQGADVYKDTVELIRNDSITGVLTSNLTDYYILDLSGCNVDTVQYYVSRGYPVMALCPNKEAVVIVGYDSQNLTMYIPMEGQIRKMGMNDAKYWFNLNGNKYITYLPKQ